MFMSNSVTLTTSSPSAEVVLDVIDDTEFEGELLESFGVRLSLAADGNNYEKISITQPVLEVLIEDNDPRPSK